MKEKIAIAFLVLLAAVALRTCITIEILNARVGGILPRKIPAMQNGKWRVLMAPEAVLPNRYEMQYRMENDFEEGPIPEAAAAEIAARVARDAPRYRTEAVLRGWVGSWGVIQYPICWLLIAAGLFLACYTSSKRSRIVFNLLFLVGVVCHGFALYRSYMGSLGW